MFGMLDYRAHKLYLLLFGIPWFLIRWMIIIGLPFLYYAIGYKVADNRLLQIIASLVALSIIEIIVYVIATYIDKFFMFIFNLFIDIIPAGNRTKDESILVVKSGEPALKLIDLGKKHPREWTDEDLSFFHSGFFAWFFKDKILHRFSMLRNHFIDNPNIPFNEWNVRDYLANNNLSAPLIEKIFTNASLRATAISYTITIVLLFINPYK